MTRSTLLGPALEAARRALRRMEPEEIPPSLRRVAGSSARRLPPPLEVSLRDELDANPWLREKALEEWEPGPVSEDPPTAASRLFLERPDGWEADMEVLQRGRESDEIREQLRQSERERERLSARVNELEARVDQMRKEQAQAVRQAVVEAAEDSDRLRRRVGELRATVGELTEARRLDHATIGRLQAELEEADERIADLKDALLRARRSGTAQPAADRRIFGRGSPRETARALDHLREALTAPRIEPTRVGKAAATSLPRDLRPDRKEAIAWLLSLPYPVSLLVDGYNVAHELSPNPSTDVRARLAAELARLRRLAEGPVHPVLFWDSADEASQEQGPRGVEVRYVPSADEAIVERANARSVVVTADREVRERSVERGAVGLWSSALVEWIRSR